MGPEQFSFRNELGTPGALFSLAVAMQECPGQQEDAYLYFFF